MEEELNCLFFFFFLTSSCQGSQYRTKGYTGLASDMIYFEYWSILVYCFGFTAIFIFINKQINIYVCMCLCVCIYIYYNKYKSLP